MSADKRCPFGGGAFQAGYLVTQADVGLLNLVRGFSIGAKARLLWSDEKLGVFSHKEALPYRKEYEGHKCTGCRRIIFSP